MTSLLIRGGTVIDGTGSKGVRADVRTQGDKITEVGPDLRPNGERVIDAGGASVMPGIIACHTHYDGPMWWNPSLDPLPGYGTTSVVMGNCGLSAAPVSHKVEDRDDMINIFSFLEDIPQKTFQNEMPWNWSKWSEYGTALAACPTAANVSGFIGHLNLRICVMGAAAWERPANANEIAQMVALLEDGLRAGAQGMSTNFFDNDSLNRPVPSKVADDKELEALANVLGRYKGAVLQLIGNLMEFHKLPEQLDRLLKLTKPRGIRVQYLAIPTDDADDALHELIFEYHQRANREGADLWGVYGTRPLTVALNFERSLVYTLQGVYAWDELVNKTPHEQKLEKLKNPEWRARARHEWDNMKPGSRLDSVEHYLNNSENGVGPVNITLFQYAAQTGLHPSDALAQWVGLNGLGSTVGEEARSISQKSVLRCLRDPHSVTGVDDAGAHSQLFCGAGESAYLFTEYVRDTGLVPLEEMVHAVTQKIANHYSLKNRGVIAPGMAADIAVFALEEIELRDIRKVVDVPDGQGGLSWRYTRDPAPFRATIVNGVATFEAGKYTGELPGKLIGPGMSEGDPLSRAAD